MADTGKSARTQRAIERACTEGAKLFAENGYSETTTRALAAAMDVTNGTFYYYFPSKEDLLRQICEDALAEITSAVAAAVDGASGTDAVTRMIHAHVSTIVASRHSHTTMLTELRALNGEHRVTVVAARDRYEALVRGVLASAKADGSLKTSIELEPLTLLLLNLLNWTIFWYRPNLSLTGDDIADRMVTLFLHGAESAI